MQTWNKFQGHYSYREKVGNDSSQSVKKHYGRKEQFDHLRLLFLCCSFERELFYLAKKFYLFSLKMFFELKNPNSMSISTCEAEEEKNIGHTAANLHHVHQASPSKYIIHSVWNFQSCSTWLCFSLTFFCSLLCIF